MDLEELKSQVQKFFGDTSHSRAETRDGLEELADEIQTMLDTLQDEQE